MNTSSQKELDELSQVLSTKFASYLIKILLLEEFGSALFNIQLYYKDVYSYWPHLSVITDNSRNELIKSDNDILFLYARFIEHKTNADGEPTLRECYSKFDKIINENKNWDAGEEMLIQTSKNLKQMITSTSIEVTNDLIVFPVDWSMCDNTEDFKNLLHRCGVNEEELEVYKEHGWI
jgi:hypothetical protein